MRRILSVAVLTLAASVLALGQATGQQAGQGQAAPQGQATAQATASELYHIEVIQAAPGQLPKLIDALRSGPAPEAGAPQVSPIILRHREGSEWDLIMIRPLGKQFTISAAPAPQAVEEFYQRLQPLSAWHGDTIATGPAWAEVQKALVPAKGEQAVYVVSDYRSVPGHRPQLRQVLERNAQDTPGRDVLFAHAEGAPWNFLAITRYDSWAAIDAPPPQPPAGQAARDAGLELREHLAVHHDTIVVYVSGGQPIR